MNMRLLTQCFCLLLLPQLIQAAVIRIDGDDEVRNRAPWPLVLSAEALTQSAARLPPRRAAAAAHSRAPPVRALQQLRPEDLTIRRLIGELGFATATEWLYDGASPANP